MPSENLFSALNHTELYQLCRKAQLQVLPSATREEMVSYLLGEEEPATDTGHAIDSWRIALAQFVIDYWKKLETQVSCPAKSLDPHACFGCTDVRVVACVVENEPSEKYIQIRRPPT